METILPDRKKLFTLKVSIDGIISYPIRLYFLSTEAPITAAV
jgi:hypothetical protein